ncbi:MAG: hypothetical protein LUQ65_04110, partial [Candidatus Helarchaeota archaeon]|nr:hypothetical protein [Candidatus Helarchaeota archaeon]
RRLTVGRSIRFLTASCLFIVCQYHQYKCNLKDISDCCQIPEKVLRKNYRLILKEFQIKLNNRPASYYLSQFCFDLKLSVQFQKLALIFLNLIIQTNKNVYLTPKVLAVVTIYLVSKKILKEKHPTQTVLSNISKVSGVTIRKYLKICERVVEIFSQKASK